MRYNSSVRGYITRRKRDLRALRDKYNEKMQQLDNNINTLMEGSNA